MRILMVSFLFPPYNNIGAVRTGKTAKYLSQSGHTVRVVTGGNQLFDSSLPLEIPAEHVTYTSWVDINRPIQLALGGRHRVAAVGYTPGRLGSLLRPLGSLYRTLTNYPDGYTGWRPFAVRAGIRIAETFKPEIIFASGPPFSCLLVGAALAKRLKIPWVAELRDLWTDGPLTQPFPRNRFERRLEDRTLATATALVTVSEPLAEALVRRHRKPIRVVFNGYDALDFPATKKLSAENKNLVIAYTGKIYEKQRDPLPLFKALRLMGPEASRIRVQFFGRVLDPVVSALREFDLGHCVQIAGNVSYQESLQAQCSADVLLLLTWSDLKTKGILTGKVFEYIGAGRPILAVGPCDAAGDLVLSRKAGYVSDRPDEIVGYLRQWLKQKDNGGIARTPDAARTGLSREEQTKILEAFLCEMVSAPSA